jgi:hypothetical protein
MSSEPMTFLNQITFYIRKWHSLILAQIGNATNRDTPLITSWSMFVLLQNPPVAHRNTKQFRKTDLICFVSSSRRFTRNCAKQLIGWSEICKWNFSVHVVIKIVHKLNTSYANR